MLIWLSPLALLGALVAVPARAGEITVESIVDQSTALREASSQVPEGNRIISTDCTQVELPGLSFRFRCTVRYTPATSAGPAGASTGP